MNPQNPSSSSSQIHKSPSQIITTTTLTHHLSPQILTKSPISLNGNHIPKHPLKKHPKHLDKVIFNTPNTNSLWDNIATMGRASDINRLKKTAEFMENTKSLTNLSLSLKTVVSFDFKYALSRFQYLQSTSNLNLKITSEHHFTPSNLKMFHHALTSLKNLNRLSLEIPQIYQVPLQLIDSIGLALRHLPSLVHFSIQFTSFAGFGDSHVKKLASHLKKLPQLQSLALNFHLCSEISTTGLQPLSEIFKNLPFLSDFNIQLLNSKGCSITTISDIFSGLATCKSLKRLNFFVKPDSDCDLDSIEPISLGLNLLNAPSLRRISLKLYPNFSQYGFTQLFQALTRFSSLTALSIDFSNESSISEFGLSQFRNALKTLASLSTLSVSSLWNEKFNQTIELISQGFGYLTELRNLSLDFTGCVGKRSTTIQTLSSNLKNLKLLKQLDLRLNSCNFVNDSDIALLSQGLEPLKDLTDLKINLANIPELTNQGLQNLFSSFSNFSKLAHFTLKLANNSTNDEVPKIIAQSLQNLPALYSLDLAFPYVEESSYNEGFGILCDSLRNLVALKNVVLEVKRTEFAEGKISELKKVKSVEMTWIWY